MKTAQEKREYFIGLRQRWQEAKKWSEKEDDDSKNDITTMYPKRYCLFHSSQVQPL